MRLLHTLHIYFALLLLVWITGCAVPKELVVKETVTMPNAFYMPGDTVMPGTKHNELISWRSFFKDTLLTQLIDSALINNLDIRIAEQRLFAASALFKANRNQLFPNLDLQLGVGLTRFGRNTIDGVGNYDVNFSPNITPDQKISNPVPDFYAGFHTSWEIDIWGKLRNRKKAAYYRYLSTQDGIQYLRTQIITQIAQLYYQLIAIDTEIEIIRRNIDLQQKAFDVILIQKESGKINELAVKQFKAQLLQIQSLMYAKTQEQVMIENALNTLTGRFAQRVIRKDSLDIRDLPSQLNAGVPSDLLLNRPDVRSSFNDFLASKADFKAAKAAFYPSLIIGGNIGINSFNPSTFFSLPGSLAFNILGGLTAPLFNRNLIMLQYRQAFAQKNEAFHLYHKKLLTSVEEVINELNRYRNYEQIARLKMEELTLMRDALQISNQLFFTGYASYLEVLMTRQNLLNSELELTEANLQQFISSIQLYRALGGSN